jgi:nitroimidazol reductase NimA-like FMN-containing flavoprotein (pyridoxamine 5'-phosphate oxidase superfamily)
MIDNDRPYIVPLNYGYYDNAIYIHSASVGKKIEILKKNNKVCFEIDIEGDLIKNEISCEWSINYRSLIGYGTIEIIKEFDEKQAGLDIIMKQHGKSENNVYKKSNVDSIVILKLNIEQITGKQSGDWD